MSINTGHPKYLDFIKNERETLNVIHNTSFIGKHFPELAECAKLQFYDLKITDAKLAKTQFTFNCNFNIEVEGQSRRIIVEAIVTPNFEHVSYVLSICEGNSNPLNVIRKFHFDYAVPNSNEDDKHIYHLQYGGKITPYITSLQIPNIENLQPWLSLPRITHRPINLALLIDFIFCEFITEDTKQFVERQEWRKFIKHNEDEVLRPFYARLNTFFSKEHKNDYLLRDFYYGRSGPQ